MNGRAYRAALNRKVSGMDLEDLRLLVYDNFRRIGRVPSNDEMATTLGFVRAPTSADRRARRVGRHAMPRVRRPNSWVVDRHKPPVSDLVAHFPVPAKDYFRSVGLIDPFWGTQDGLRRKRFG